MLLSWGREGALLGLKNKSPGRSWALGWGVINLEKGKDLDSDDWFEAWWSLRGQRSLMGLDQPDWWKWHRAGLSVTLGERSHFGFIQVALLEEAGEPLSGPPNTAIWSG